MRYLMLICGTESPDTPVDLEEDLDEDTTDWAAEMGRRGVREQGSRLRPTSTATTIRTENGELLVSDGPFAETKEQILGFDLIECADLDEAIEVASRHPVVKSLGGTIEVRPLWPT
ncbi:YciI family protein [Amycolatopsis sp. H20-H5]|uniref:YciI family protein n=1 Tax=Amycolatopsis sp. H20-H5 TaxID=3046309 RepID=UPI002DBBD47E|nr:YciI family protein [Amycolatopsis sp. H20-H5]MEC3978595.1 YciI family protein [Amycolatopsis sp. H20-H5]